MQLLDALVLVLSCVSLARAAAIGDFLDGGLADLMSQNTSAKVACKPFVSTFPKSDVTQFPFSPFIGISPPDSYEATGNGLRMFLKKPKEPVIRQGHVNNVVGEGATINSTFLLPHGKVMFEVKAPPIAGSVTAVILIADGRDEIDTEILGGDLRRWQTNVFAPSPKDQGPQYGLLSGKEGFVSETDTINDFHNYTIDWNATRIIWSVDGKPVRTLKPSQTRINDTEHYPTQAARIQLGIWDASTPEGTSEWAKGPIDWETAPPTISAIVKRVQVECP